MKTFRGMVVLAPGIEGVLPPQPCAGEPIDCGALRLCTICDDAEFRQGTEDWALRWARA